MMGLALGGMIGSTVIVETLFSLPGMGTLIVRAAQQGDSPMLLGAVVVIAGHLRPRQQCDRCSVHLS